MFANAHFPGRWVAGCGLVLFSLAPLESAHAGSTETVLYSFPGNGEGASPNGGLIADKEGNLYGTTYLSSGYNCRDGCGSVFKITPEGEETELTTFDCKVGCFPTAGLIADRKGDLYGTTSEGGKHRCEDVMGAGCGTIFEITRDGVETPLYSFAAGADGAYPHTNLITDQAGDFYGTTAAGGGTGCNNQGCGTVFELAPDGTETVLYSFQGGSDGAAPYAGLIMDADGTLYGTTSLGGGAGCGGSGCGTVFELAPDGTETVLYAFQGGSDGAMPLAGLISDARGDLYGTTYFGGGTGCNSQGCGIVFRLSSKRTEKVLYAFTGASDGADPAGELIGDGAGGFYGTTFNGGANGDATGTVFRLAKDGTETVLYNFCSQKNCADGQQPSGSLLADKAGNLYGATQEGGAIGYGTVFKLTN